MPLPKPSKSKTVSRRIKKPKPLLFTAAPEAEELPPSEPIKPPRERRVRVICTDPDATDSSSDEEAERAPIRPRYTHKRFVCEIPLPASPPSSFYAPPTSFNENQQEETSMGSASSSSTCVDSEKRKGCVNLEERKGLKIARKEVGLRSLYERTNEPVTSPSADDLSECLSVDNLSAGSLADNLNAGLSADNSSAGPPAVNLSGCLSVDNLNAGPPADNLSAGVLVDNLSAGLLADNLSESPTSEEFEQFLTEFFGVHDENSIPTWDREMDLLDDSIFNNPLAFELDFDSATWINSVQTV